MSDKNAKIYAPEFKESSAKLALESKSTIAKTARELGVNVNTLHTWIHKYSGVKTANAIDDDKLHAELKRLPTSAVFARAKSGKPLFIRGVKI
jgi:transposase